MSGLQSIRVHPVPVGLGEIRTGRDGETLVCYGLGSCVGVGLVDPVARVGAMAHVVLPDSSLSRGAPVEGKFADTAVPALVAQLLRMGAQRARLIAKIAGGARVIHLPGESHLDIGARNVEAVKEALRRAGIPLAAEDTGGSYGRTVLFYTGTGQMVVSTVGRGERIL
ncbi:MAG: chemotaxis protein CheD [Firmicutes bacterium]|nr:chemotaxis protein CheD [Bacillota bacterium]